MGYASKVRGTSTAVEDVDVTTPTPVCAGSIPWSVQQEAIFFWGAHGTGNLSVVARAGTGKTTTIIEMINRMPESSILFAAFNKRIATEGSRRLTNPVAEAKTLHAIGWGLIREYWHGVRIARDVRQRAEALTLAACGKDVPGSITRLVSKLHTKAREINPYVVYATELEALAEQFECEPEGFWAYQGYGLDYVCEKAYKALTLSLDETLAKKTGIDYADMIALPLLKHWAMGRYEAVVVDEAQDMTVPQLDLARRVLAPGGRFCVVGDDRQAIYGFRGADTGSMARLTKELNSAQLKLTTTYRCAKAIVALAQTEVPDFTVGPDNPEGTITDLDAEQLVETAQPGDFILSRVNAPLASYAMRLLQAGKRAEIAGRDIGTGLLIIIRKVSKGTTDVNTFLDLMEAWRVKEGKRLRMLGFETRANQVEDQAETIYYLSDGANTVRDIERRIEALFSDNGPDAAHVLLSSVHKAKGLEANRVFLLAETFRRGRTQEESNIWYVAVTRAKTALVWVRQ